MKYLVCLLLLEFIFGCLCLAQTQIWVSPNSHYLVEDGQGNTYVARTFGYPDSLNTLKKINAQGTVIWERQITTNYFTMHYNGSGIYICPFNWGSISENQIFYYDTAGALQWTYTMPFSGTTFGGKGQIDNSGNLVFAYDSLPFPETTILKILKLNSQGQKILDVILPQIKLLNPSFFRFYGPYVNSSGNIWIVLESGSNSFTKYKNMSRESETGDEVAVLIDGITGNILTQKNIFKKLTSENKYYTNGDKTEFDTDGVPYTNFVSYGEDLIGYGSLHTMKSTWKRSRLTEEDNTKWMLARLSPSGALKLFTYKGNGASIYSNMYEGKTTSDESNNYITSVAIGSQNELFIYGTIAKGKSKEFVGDFHVNEILLCLDPNTFKIIWKVSNPMPQGSYTSLCFFQSIQKFIRGITVNTCNQSLEVVDKDGKVSSTKLNFPECVWLPDASASGEIQGPNYEPGMIYLWTNGGISKFDVNNVIAKMDFNRISSVEQTSNLETFSLNQNYPNPFNPITTISFNLPVDALVTLRVYNTLGQEVASLLDHEEIEMGEQQMEFDGSQLSSGVYFYQLEAHDLSTNSGQSFIETKKLILMK